jgi:hypothetical protein
VALPLRAEPQRVNRGGQCREILSGERYLNPEPDGCGVVGIESLGADTASGVLADLFTRAARASQVVVCGVEVAEIAVFAQKARDLGAHLVCGHLGGVHRWNYSAAIAGCQGLQGNL